MNLRYDKNCHDDSVTLMDVERKEYIHFLLSNRASFKSELFFFASNMGIQFEKDIKHYHSTNKCPWGGNQRECEERHRPKMSSRETFRPSTTTVGFDK